MSFAACCNNALTISKYISFMATALMVANSVYEQLNSPANEINDLIGRVLPQGSVYARISLVSLQAIGIVSFLIPKCNVKSERTKNDSLVASTTQSF